MKLIKIISIVAILLPVVLMTNCEKDDATKVDENKVDNTLGLNPTILSTSPSNNETGVSRNLVASVTFSEAMDSNTINATSFIIKEDDNIISGNVNYSGGIATFTALGTLSSAKNYTAIITTTVKSFTGKSLVSNYTWTFTTGGNTGSVDPINLGAAGNYVILAKTAVNNGGTSAITGDIGLSPAATSYITGLSLTNLTGYATSAQVTEGSIYAANMADPTPINLTTAVKNMITAYNDAAGRSLIDFSELGTGNIGGKTLTAGIYKWTSSVSMPADITISGSSTDVWIFQIAQDLTMSSGVKIILIGGAKPSNIFWQVAGQATFGTTSHFEGVILSKTGITFQTDATMNGRALAQTAVVLDGNTITKP